MTYSCTATNRWDFQYQEFSCLYPTLGRTYTEWEKYYDPVPVLSWMQEHPMVPIVAVSCYGVFCIWGQAEMKKRNSMTCKKILALWNLCLSIFSWIGAFRTGPHLLHNLMTLSFRDNLCIEPQTTYGSGSSGLWVQLFILSKFPELVDTFFIVIHKKPLIFLHWYHHVTVLLYCWHSYVTTSPSGLFFVVMNYSVHAIMYGYYFLMAIRMKPKWLNAMIITTAQMSQMVVGLFITMFTFYYYGTVENDQPCKIEKQNNIAAFIMYGSYLILFAQFFVGRYFTVKATTQKKMA